MKRILFVFFVCIISSSAWAQHKLFHPIYSSATSNNARIASNTSAVLDTLTKLPFIHDFFTLYYPIDHIDNTPASPTTPISVTTLRFHGLKDKDSVELMRSPRDTVSKLFLPALVGTWYVKVTSKYSFDLYQDKTLVTPLARTGAIIVYARIKSYKAYVIDIPDSLAFYNRHGGVLVNPSSSYAINPISYFCATFDGLDAKGVPYNTINALAVGYTDTLTSQAFDLSAYVPSDSLYMSFFYETAGFGDVPDLTDRIELEFLKSDTTWVQVWEQSGGSNAYLDSFFMAMVAIKDPSFLHKGFQFRFKSYGRQSGTYDVWNLDYIYINKGRTITIPFDHRDFSISSVDESILTNYCAMPYRHFFTNQTAFLKSNLSFNVINQSLDGKSREYRFYLSDNFNTPANNINSNLYSTSIDSLMWRNTYTSSINQQLTNINKPLYITQRYEILDSLSSDSKLSDGRTPFSCMFNNIVSRGTTLYDYYAYDDNTAEYAFGSNAAGSKVAVQFTAEAADTLTHIDISYAESKGGNLNGLKIYLIVWASDLKTELINQVITVNYTSFINGFNRYQLEKPIALSTGQVYYVGYLQNFQYLLTLGYDRNNDHTNKIFYNTDGSKWNNLSNDAGTVTGSLMIHPVFSKGEILTDVQPATVAQKKTLELYPNPAYDIISIVHLDDLNYQIYSLYGQPIASGVLDTENNHQINVQEYASGMYIIICTDNLNNTYTARFIKE